jgi:uncharacterized LabA/DUF88 family protein
VSRPRVWVYVDGFNLFHRALSKTPYKWLDLGKLAKFLLPDHEVEQIRYFTAIVDPRPGHPHQQQKQQAYIRALETLDHLSVHYGKFKTRTVRLPRANPRRGESRFVEVLRTDEKGSDVNLATYLLADGFRASYEAAVVVSNDSDLVKPIQVVREELRLPVGVIITDPKTDRSALPADFHRRIRKSQLSACQFPPLMGDEDGTIHKPKGW